MKKLIGGYYKPYYHYTSKEGVSWRRAASGFYVMTVFMAALTAGALGFWQNQKPAAAAAKSSIGSVASNKVNTRQLPLVSSNNLPISDSAKLQDIIAQFAASHPTSQWSVSLQGLGELAGNSASYNSDLTFNAASIFKLLLIYPLSQKLPLDAWDITDLNVSSGTERSLRNCVDAMLRVSDNDCAVAVGNFVGWKYADNQLKKLGLTHTNLNNPAGPTTTASDTALYMQDLASGQTFDSATSQFVLGILSNQIYRSGIPAGCPGCAVADKTGDLGSVRHDVALVNVGSGSYVLSIFTNGAPYSQIAQLTSQIQNIISSN